jgi:hypothetical protein
MFQLGLQQIESAAPLLDRIGDQGPHLAEAAQFTRCIG